jgi:hypothetical protein
MRSRTGALGVGAAACAACCAGPVLGAISAIGIATAVGYAIAGAVALVLGAAAAALVLHRRHRRGARTPERGTPVAFLTMSPATPGDSSHPTHASPG